MKNEKGFTLLEILASLVIITIILLAFSRIFIQSTDFANLSSERLVVMNLADAYLERLRIEGQPFEVPAENEDDTTFEETIELNNQTYPVEIKVKIDDSAEILNLQNVVVTVYTPDKRSRAAVEGYIAYENED